MVDKGFLDELEKCRKILEESTVSDACVVTAPYWVYGAVSEEDWIHYLETHPKVEVVFIKDFTKNIRYKLNKEGKLIRI